MINHPNTIFGLTSTSTPILCLSIYATHQIAVGRLDLLVARQMAERRGLAVPEVKEVEGAQEIEVFVTPLPADDAQQPLLGDLNGEMRTRLEGIYE